MSAVSCRHMGWGWGVSDFEFWNVLGILEACFWGFWSMFFELGECNPRECWPPHLCGAHPPGNCIRPQRVRLCPGGCFGDACDRRYAGGHASTIELKRARPPTPEVPIVPHTRPQAGLARPAWGSGARRCAPPYELCFSQGPSTWGLPTNPFVL